MRKARFLFAAVPLSRATLARWLTMVISQTVGLEPATWAISTLTDTSFLTGRLKEIINRGGEKVSPKEIDEALLDHPDISQAAAFPAPHPTLGEDIAAMIVVHENAQVSEQSIREYLLDRMAEFKVPSRVFIVDEIPKSATEK